MTSFRAMSHGVQVGEPAPDFELEGTDGPFRLSEHRGDWVVLLFYPGDRTPVCTRQFCSYRDDSELMGNLDATVVGISPQSIDSHRRGTLERGLTVPLLADPDARVARLYGAYVPVRGTTRSIVILDDQGIVRRRDDRLVGLTYASAEQLDEMLDSVRQPA